MYSWSKMANIFLILCESRLKKLFLFLFVSLKYVTRWNVISFLYTEIMKLHLFLFEYPLSIFPIRSNYRNNSIAREFK